MTQPPSYYEIFPEKRLTPLPLSPVMVQVEVAPPIEPDKPGLFGFTNKRYLQWFFFGLFCSYLASFRLSWRYRMNCAKVS